MKRFQFKLKDITLIEYNEAIPTKLVKYVPKKTRRFWLDRLEHIKDSTELLNSECYDIAATLKRLEEKDIIMVKKVLVFKPHVILHLRDGSMMEETFDTAIAARDFVNCIVHRTEVVVKGSHFDILE